LNGPEVLDEQSSIRESLAELPPSYLKPMQSGERLQPYRLTSGASLPPRLIAWLSYVQTDLNCLGEIRWVVVSWEWRDGEHTTNPESPKNIGLRQTIWPPNLAWLTGARQHPQNHVINGDPHASALVKFPHSFSSSK
jgi:hypothetical protein